VVAVLALAALAATVGARPVLAAPPPPPTSQPAGDRATPAPAPESPPRPDNLTPMDSGYGPTPQEEQAIEAAAAKARSTGTPVTVDALTSETQQLTAQPSGGFTLSATPAPVRTRQHGKWVPISTTLRRNSDGTWSPTATAYGTVRFSGGGTGPLAVTSSGGLRYSVSWPTKLPVPAVSGSTVTYRNVLGEGVDLVVSATDTGGFSDTLIVADAQAARNPALATLRLSTAVSGGAQRSGHGVDSVLVFGSGRMVLESGTPQMWDSRTTVAGEAAPAPDRSDIAHPGLAAHIASVHLRPTSGGLDLTPDAGMLRDRATVFPVYVDPTLNWHIQDANAPNFDEIKSGSPCNGASYWNNTGAAGNYGRLGVGWNGWDSCIGIERALYQWSIPTVIWGSTVHLATVNATEVYASTCSTTSTINLHESGGIGPGTDWNSRPSYTGKFATSASYASASNPNYCPNSADVTHAFTVTSRMQVAATQKWSQWTIALTNDADESSHNRNGFKRFAKNPVLAINYDRAPATPSAVVMSAKAGSTNAGCATAAPYPIIGKTIASNPPTLNTKVTDPDTDKTQATFKYWVDGTSTTYTGKSADNLANSSIGTYSLPSSFVSSLTNGKVVDWQVQVTDGLITSGWSTVCHFAVLPTGPDAPVIQPNTSYPDTSDGGGIGAAAGTAATWGVAGTSTGAPAVRFVYGLDQPPATSSPPASQVRAATGTVLSAPAGRWKLDEGTGTTMADSSGNSHPASAANVGWATDATRGKVAVFNGTSSTATAAGPVLDTSASYSVSAWVNLANTTTYSTIISQQNTSTTVIPFYLQYNKALNSWTFIVNNTSTGGGQTAVHAAGAPTLDTWTHLVGVHNATSHTISLYINGTLVGTTSYTTPWNSTGAFNIGHAGASNYFPGQISDVQAYQRALTTADIQTMYSFTTVTATPLAPGPHTLYAYGVDAAGDVSADDAYPFIAAGTTTRTCASLADCFNNTAISPDSNMGLGHADGAGWSYSATDLANAGWTSGGKVAINGAPFTLPAFGAGQADNVLAANQTITYTYPVPTTGLSALTFLASSTDATTSSPGAIVGNTTAPYVPAGTQASGVYCFDSTDPAAYCPAVGTITYADGTQQSYDLTVPDWVSGPGTLSAVTLPHRNRSGGQQTNPAKIYPFSVPLTPGKTVQSITLPDVGSTVTSYNQALHIFGLSVRNTTTGTIKTNGTTMAAPAGKTWTGTWGSPTEGLFTFTGTFSNLTIRTFVTPSVAGDTIRIKLDNATGTSPLVIGHATVALDDHTRMTNLTFSGNAGITLPGGGMAYSDPIAFPVTTAQELLVSFTLTNSVSYLPMATLTNYSSYTYISANGSGDHTADTTETAFTGSGTHVGYFTDVLANVDVTTLGVATQAVLGDGLIDFWDPNTTPVVPSLRDDLASDVASSSAPYGIIAENVESNEIMSDQWGYGGPAALSRIDRDVLDQPGINSVILYQGLEDLLRGRTADDVTANGATQLLTYLQANNIAVIANGLTPCDGYAGGGSTPNDPCTASVDSERTATNAWLNNFPLGMGPWSTPPLFYIDADTALGIPDTANGETKLHPAADGGDHANLSYAGYGALASAYLGPQDTWQLNDGVNPADGSIDTTVTTAADTATNANNPYLLNNPNTGQHPAALSGAATWTNDPARGGVLSLDGTTGYAITSGPVLDTASSFSISAWVNMTNLPTRNATVAAQNGTTASAFYLGYNYTHANTPGWTFTVTPSDTTNPALPGVTVDGATTGWTHLVGVYNAVNHTAQLYVNGDLKGTATNVTSWAATGDFTIGNALWNGNPSDHLPAAVSDIQAWNYALMWGDQVDGLYRQIQ
jgi:Concanavalin A-like lectin/glucanases superfamily